jgi:hypothetical protein
LSEKGQEYKNTMRKKCHNDGIKKQEGETSAWAVIVAKFLPQRLV